MHDIVEQAYPFQQASKDRLNDGIERLVRLYAKCVTKEDHAAAARSLRAHQREHIAWERDTVWRTMIGQARRGEGNGAAHTPLGAIVVADEDEAGALTLQVPTRMGRVKIPRRAFAFVAAVVVFVVLLNVRVVEEVEANRCFAVLVFSTILWATEVRSWMSPFHTYLRVVIEGEVIRLYRCS